ncbi:MAG TPA: hypothetical protein VIY73_29010, partial [Polyangiaceae bacterium]
MRSSFFLAVVFAALSLAACSAATTGEPSPTGSTGQDGGLVSTTTGTGTDAGSVTGTLLLQAFGGPSGSVAAQVPVFDPGAGPKLTCGTPVSSGACSLTSCQVGGIGSAGGDNGDLGTLTASVGATSVNIPYVAPGYPTVYFPPSVTLGTGGTMTFQGGDGVNVPVFEVSATIPGVAVLTAPAPPTAGASTPVDTSQALSVTWVPIPAGQIHFAIDGGTGLPGGIAVSLACTFDGPTGA